MIEQHFFRRRRCVLFAGGFWALNLMLPLVEAAAAPPRYDLLIHGGTVYDGLGGRGRSADVAITGDRIVFVGPHAPGQARQTVDARGKAIAPGFINMLSWANETLLVDGRAQSDLRQGVTLEVMGEGWSMGPYTPTVARQVESEETDFRYSIDWSTLDQYLRKLEARGVAPNVASFVGATTVREDVLGYEDVQPSPVQLKQMQDLVHDAMKDGALGVSSAIIYPPATFAHDQELKALAATAGSCGGIYISHIRSEGDHLVEAVDEAIDIGRTSGTPVEIYHLKSAGLRNHWKFDTVIAHIEAARAQGLQVTADMYTYTSALSSLSAALPPWTQQGTQQQWLAQLDDPSIRARVVAELRSPTAVFENYYELAGAASTIPVSFKSAALKSLEGQSIAEIARTRGTPPEETIIDLMREDKSPVGATFDLTTESEVIAKLHLPWISFGSDAGALSTEGVFLQSSTHPRTYGNFARLLGRYVRDEKQVSMGDAIRRLTGLPAATLHLDHRGLLAAGYYADIVLFDPITIRDVATFNAPHQYAQGVSDVWVNGRQALKDGVPTGASTGKVVRGQGWRGSADGGCRNAM